MIDQLRKVRYDKQQAEQPKPAEKPAPKPWKPTAGEMVQITRPGNGFAEGVIVKIIKLCPCCGRPVAINPFGDEVLLWNYLPVREEDRAAKVGDYIKLIHQDHPVGYTGTVQKVIDSGSGPDFDMVYINIEGKRIALLQKRYRVLVPYDPQEAEHA
jgi:hypothetical protein